MIIRKFGFWCCLRNALWGLLPLLLLLIGALAIGLGPFQEKLSGAAGKRLKAAGHDWAKVGMDGRDLLLEGEAPTKRAAAEAARIAAGVYGVRRVDDARVRVADTTAPAAPAIAGVAMIDGKPALHGVWPEGDAKVFSVTIDGRTYVMGRDAQLKNEGGGQWTLKPGYAFAPGRHDAHLVAVDAAGNVADVVAKDAVVIAAPKPRPTVKPRPRPAPAPDTTPPATPALGAVSVANGSPRLAGTWPEGDAKVFSVTIDGRTYVMGRDRQLRNDGKGRWRLNPGYAFAPGRHDAHLVAVDAAGNVADKVVRGAVVIAAPKPKPQPQPQPEPADTTPPPAPTVDPLKVEAGKPFTLTGTWAEKETDRLTVIVRGSRYVLGRGALTGDGPNRWKLPIGGIGLAGRHEVMVIAADAAGNTSEDGSRGEITVVVPVDCPKLLNEALEREKIRFASNRAAIRAASQPQLDKLAAIIKSKCPRTVLEIGGHTDSTGNSGYNQRLSEQRARAVRDELIKRGIAAGRLIAVGYGETHPVASNRTRKGRAANRRIEFTIKATGR